MLCNCSLATYCHVRVRAAGGNVCTMKNNWVEMAALTQRTIVTLCPVRSFSLTCQMYTQHTVYPYVSLQGFLLCLCIL